ncbi:MAG: alpha/beta hydrolase [Vulcanimicrobiaceae bacterium]|jgi:pimeloyl-ACP methyl ester carboxylesterase
MLGLPMKIQLDDQAHTTCERWGTIGPVILCVHGGGGSRKSWTRTAERLSDRYQVVAYDQRGHGDSARVAGPMAYSRGVADLRNVADAVGGADFVIGHSWGGAVVILAGASVARRGVVAIDPPVVQPTRDWYENYIAELDGLFAQTGEARDAAVRASVAAWHWSDAEARVHAMHAMTTEPIIRLRDENRGCDLRKDIASYSMPLLLLLAGKRGSVNPEPVYDEVLSHRAPTVSIVSFEDQGHSLHRTAFEPYIDALEAFLTAAPPA